MRFLRSSLISFLKIYAYINGTIIFLEVFQPPNGLTGRNFCGEPSVSELMYSNYENIFNTFLKKYWSPNPRLELCRDRHDGQSPNFFLKKWVKKGKN